MLLSRVRELRQELQRVRRELTTRSPLGELLTKSQKLVDHMMHEVKADTARLRDQLAVHAPSAPDSYQGDLAVWPWYHADAVLSNRNPTTGDDADGKEEG